MKKNSSLRTKLIMIVVPIVLVIIIAFFVLARNMVLKISKEQMLAQQLDQILANQQTAANRISSSAKDMSKSTENVTLSSSIVAESAQELKKESLELMDKMSQFRL